MKKHLQIAFYYLIMGGIFLACTRKSLKTMSSIENAVVPAANSTYVPTGKVVVDVCANQKGIVVSTVYNPTGSTTFDTSLINESLQRAAKFRFQPSKDTLQCGKITFNYMLK